MKTPFGPPNKENKDQFIYIRLEPYLKERIGILQKRGFKSLSDTIRSMLKWSLENGIEVSSPERPGVQKTHWETLPCGRRGRLKTSNPDRVTCACCLHHVIKEVI
jgi:hypothetical protein